MRHAHLVVHVRQRLCRLREPVAGDGLRHGAILLQVIGQVAPVGVFCFGRNRSLQQVIS